MRHADEDPGSLRAVAIASKAPAICKAIAAPILSGSLRRASIMAISRRPRSNCDSTEAVEIIQDFSMTMLG
jgi:hypothetical protein